ncbi:MULTISPECIES: ScbA/BarX family gamma-butyrolactone biosynthesis protein [Kitasatospora]|uniref:ScbA/BarX family gamma-butyrolactone biosynthesis protein n=1 Tax=Kitasatospora cystarginea TaxID=58350 RepID=A0ABP5RS77_9ACTN
MATSPTITHQRTTVDPPPSDVPSLVRKSVPAEALVTGWRQLPDGAQRVTARWPHAHAFYAEDGRYSPLLFTETARQALALLTSGVHHVPLGHRLGMERIRIAVNPAALRVADGPSEVDLLVRHSLVRHRRLGSAQFVSHVEATRAGLQLGEAEVHYSTHPPAVYDRLRGRYADAREAFARALPPGPPVPAPRVGRGSEGDVVLTPTDSAHRWRLRLDVGHRVLFDHPHDHVPGMVLLEAAAQAAQAVVDHPVVAVAFDTTFLRYVEFDRPCLVTAEPGPSAGPGRCQVEVGATQDGAPVFTLTVTTAPREV